MVILWLCYCMNPVLYSRKLVNKFSSITLDINLVSYDYTKEQVAIH